MYRTGEELRYGDIVQGIPNGTNSKKKINGFVIAEHSGGIAVCFIKPGSIADTIRVYGEAENFDLIARNEAIDDESL